MKDGAEKKQIFTYRSPFNWDVRIGGFKISLCWWRSYILEIIRLDDSWLGWTWAVCLGRKCAIERRSHYEDIGFGPKSK